MGVTFAVHNAKGGVGKTTSAANIAAMAAALPNTDGSQRRVLLCDLDPQMNCTQQLGYEEVEPHKTLAGHVSYESDLEPLIIENAATIPGLDFLPAHYQLAFIDEGILETGTWLRRKLGPFRSRYDLILFDCPYHLGHLTRNAFAASNGLLIPTQAEKHSVLGLPHLLARARRIFEETEVVNPWAYILLTMVSIRYTSQRTWVEQVRKQYGDAVLGTLIRRNTDLEKSASGGMPIVAFDDKCTGYEDYLAVTTELLQLLEADRPALRIVGTKAVNS